MNRAPTFAAASEASVTVENQTDTNFQVLANDADDDALIYEIIGGADAGAFTIDIQSGVVRFLAAPDFENPADADGDNVYQLVVRASDGDLSASQTVTISVSDVDDESPIAGPDAEVFSGEVTTYSGFTATASDPDTDNLIFTLSGGADQALFRIDAQTGVVRFLERPDFESPQDANGDNVYEIATAASDGTRMATQQARMTVLDQFDSPAISITGGLRGDFIDRLDTENFRTTGDLDGDGLRDFLISAQYADEYGIVNPDSVFDRVGRTFWISSSGILADADAHIEAPLIAQPLGGIFRTSVTNRLGYSLGAGGDLTGDNVEDFVIGSITGLNYLINGASYSALAQSDVELSYFEALPPVHSVLRDDIVWAEEIEILDDLNGDGAGELLVDFVAEGIRIFFSSTYNDDADGLVNWKMLPTEQSVLISEDGSCSISVPPGSMSVGDVDGNGMGDLLLHRRQVPETAGAEVVIVFGEALASSDGIDFCNIENDEALILSPAAAGEPFPAGHFVLGVAIGDLDEDGVGDFGFYARLTDDPPTFQQPFYIVFGTSLRGMSGVEEFASLPQADQVRIIPDVKSLFLLRDETHSVGDVNGDGVNDLITFIDTVGAPFQFTLISGAPILGARGGEIELATLSTHDMLNFTFSPAEPVGTPGRRGRVVGDTDRIFSAIGDYDGDGLNDLMVQDPDYRILANLDPDEPYVGRIRVFSGFVLGAEMNAGVGHVNIDELLATTP